MRRPNKITYRMKRVETTINQPIEEALRRKYVDENKSAHEIASELGVAYRIIVKWLKLCGVYSRRLRIERDA